MAHNKSKTPSRVAEGASQPGGGDQDGGLPERVTDDLGGVQGAAPAQGDPDAQATASPALEPGAPDDAPAPDAGEIEWAGQLVKKPPAPEG